MDNATHQLRGTAARHLTEGSWLVIRTQGNGRNPGVLRSGQITHIGNRGVVIRDGKGRERYGKPARYQVLYTGNWYVWDLTTDEHVGSPHIMENDARKAAMRLNNEATA